MLKSAYQKKERQGRKKPNYTRALDCDIDVSTLKRLADEDGDCLWGGKHTQRTYRDTIDALLKSTRTYLNTGQCTLRLQYSYGKLGRDLFEAGHITASREYSQGDDPFKLPKRLQQAALGKISVAYDDNAAYPRAKMPAGGDDTRRFTTWLRLPRTQTLRVRTIRELSVPRINRRRGDTQANEDDYQWIRNGGLARRMGA